MDQGLGKTIWKAGNMVVPAPAALVSCALPDGTPNLITIGWCGNINTNPPMLSISIRPERYSYGIIEQSGEFVCNLPSLAIAREVDYCGVVSGRDIDKFAQTGLTPFAMEGVGCPAVVECPINIACKVKQVMALGSHSLFLAEVVEVAVNDACVDRTGKFRLDQAGLLCYAHGFYYGLGDLVGHFGWSVRKKPVAKAGGRKRPPAKKKRR